MQQGVLSFEKRDDGVVIVRIDVPGETVNTIKEGFAEELARVLSEPAALGNAKGVVLASGKPDSFIAGADIKMLQQVTTASQAADLSRTGQRVLARLAELGRPVVAAIHGACLGGGLEVALACHGRVATDDARTKLGVPEVMLGVLPALGGTQRLPRLIGLQPALDLLLTGRQVSARRALKLGLVDELVEESVLIEAAAKLTLRLAEKPRDVRRRRTQRALSKRSVSEVLFAENPLGRKLFFDQAKKRLLQKTRGNYPATERIIDVVKVGLAKGIDRGLHAEAQAFGDLVVSPEAAELMNIFTATRSLKKESGVDDPSVAPRRLTQVGVVGAGLMGAGIAYVTAVKAGLPVRIKDRDDESVSQGMKSIRKLCDEQVERKRMTPREADRVMAMVTPTTENRGFGAAELVIEAVFEDLALKRQVLDQIEQSGHVELIFASNTSSLPITKLAEPSPHPERVVGMHYFSPVNKMPLLEVVVTDKTAPWVTATAVELGKQQGKTVIVVHDGPGFYTTRILAPYLNEAAFLLSEGVPIEKIDEALVDWGFPVGPIALIDEVGIDVAEKIAVVLNDAFGNRLRPPSVMERLVTDKRLGRKNQRGFYSYRGQKKRGKKPVDASVYAVLGVEPHGSETPTTIVQRCVLQMVNEAARCYGEGIVKTARDADIGAIFGLGFPPFRGGPFRYVDAVGAEQIVRRLERYHKEHGERFAPAPALIEMGRSGQRFYGEGARASAPAPAAQGLVAPTG